MARWVLGTWANGGRKTFALRAALLALMAVAAPALLAGSAPADNPELTASFTFSPATPVAGMPVTFTSTSSGGAVIVSAAWDFDGDGVADAFGSSATHVFASAAT